MKMFTHRPSEKSPAKIGLACSNLRPGDFCSPGIYVVCHRDPEHSLPHEISITSLTILPTCGECRGVRFSYKCAIPKQIEECEFFAVDSAVLAAHARSAAQEMRDCAERSRSLMAESLMVLAALDRSVYSNGRPLASSNQGRSTL
jgi:hypothetical protein